MTVSYMNLRFQLGDFNAMKREFNARESSMIKNLHNRQIMIFKKITSKLSFCKEDIQSEYF